MIRKIFILIMLFATLAGAAYVTKPGAAEFDQTLREALFDRVANADISQSDTDAEALAVLGCRLSASECFRAVRAVMDVRFEDKILFTLAEVRRPDETTCIGAFGQFWCGDMVF